MNNYIDFYGNNYNTSDKQLSKDLTIITYVHNKTGSLRHMFIKDKSKQSPFSVLEFYTSGQIKKTRRENHIDINKVMQPTKTYYSKKGFIVNTVWLFKHVDISKKVFVYFKQNNISKFDQQHWQQFVEQFKLKDINELVTIEDHILNYEGFLFSL